MAYYNQHSRVAGSVEDPMAIGSINKNDSCKCITWETSRKSKFFEELKEDGLIDKEVGYHRAESYSYPYVYSKFNKKGKRGNRLGYFV